MYRGYQLPRSFVVQLSHPERLWQHVWDSLIHTNRRGWEIIILGALDVALAAASGAVDLGRRRARP